MFYIRRQLGANITAGRGGTISIFNSNSKEALVYALE
jgi:hypothetical protein